MHELLRDMGHTVVIERTQQKRQMQRHIWDPSMAAKVIQKRQMEELPQGIQKLVKLKFLHLDSCSSLPNSLGELSELVHLDISRCSSISSLPNLRFPVSLQILKLYSCPKLIQLPESCGSLCNLEELRVDWCELLGKLPASFSKL